MPPSRYRRKRSLAGVIAAMAVVNLVYGITFPLLALVLDGQGVSKTLIGLNTMVQALAVIATLIFVQILLRNFVSMAFAGIEEVARFAHIALVFLLWFFVHHTRIGLAFRAMAQNERTALSVGIESDWIGSLSMALGGALAALAAMVVLPLGMMESSIGLEVLIYALAVAIVGGLESTLGMVVGSFIIGFGQIAAARYIGAKWMIIAPLAAIVLVLVMLAVDGIDFAGSRWV